MTKKKQIKQSNQEQKPVAKDIIVDDMAINYKSSNFWTNHWIEICFLTALSFILYFQSISFGYILDDKIVITENEYTKKGFDGIYEILTTESFQGYFGEQKDLVAGARYRPLSIVSYAVEFGLLKALKPGISHFINILLYALCSIFLFQTLKILFPVDSSRSRWFQFAFLASILWLVHPVHSEAVANIKGRDEIMSLMFSILAMYYALKFSFNKKWLNLIFSGLALFLGLMSKEGAITFLGIIPLSLYFFTNTKKRRYVPIMISISVAALVYLIIRFEVIGYFLSSGKEITDLMNNPFYGMSGAEKSATIMYTLFEYLRLSVFPLTLTHDYYPFHIPTVNWGHWKVLLSLCIHFALFFIAIRGLKKKTVPAYYILFYAFALSIASNIFFPVGTFMNERFLFTATIGVSIALVWLLIKYLPTISEGRYSYLFYGIFILLVTFFSIRTLIRVPVWESALTLNKAAVKVSVNSARANCFMGTALFSLYRETSDRNEQARLLDEAEFYINKSADLFPAYNNANIMIAGIAAEKYKVDKDLEKLLSQFKRVIKYRPETEFIHQYLEYINERNAGQNLIAFYLDVSQNIDVAVPNRDAWRVKYLQYAYAIDPGNREVNRELGKIFERAGNSKQANFYFNRAGGPN